MTVVNFLVVVAIKAGTTSLHQYLSSHDELFLPKKKELNFFSIDSEFEKGIAYYASNFPQNSNQLCGEVSPRYMIDIHAPGRIYETVGNIKIIMILRDPIDRAQSHHAMMVKRGKELTSWSEWVSKLEQEDSVERESVYIQYGCYGRILADYLKYFDMSSICVIYTRDLENFPVRTMKCIAKFLGVSKDFDEKYVSKKYHVGGEYRFPVLMKLVKYIVSVAAKHKSRINRLLPRSFLNFVNHAIFKFETQTNVKPSKREKITYKEKEILNKIFREDVDLFCRLSGRSNPWEIY